MKQEPFSATSLRDAYFETAQHQSILSQIKYFASQTYGLSLVIGAKGSGKTMLAEKFFSDILPDSIKTIFLRSPYKPFNQNLVCQQILNQTQGKSKKQENKFFEIETRLESLQKSGKRVVFVVDDADQFFFRETVDLIEKVIEKKLASFVLFSQEQAGPFAAQMNKYVVYRVRVDSLNESETRRYIKSRVKASGFATNPFSKEAMQEIYSCSKGKLEKINFLAGHALVEGFIQRKSAIDKDLIDFTQSYLEAPSGFFANSKEDFDFSDFESIENSHFAFEVPKIEFSASKTKMNDDPFLRTEQSHEDLTDFLSRIK